MSKVRLPLLIAGAVGALVVMVLVFIVIRIGRGTPVELPVAATDIAPGTAWFSAHVSRLLGEKGSVASVASKARCKR